MSKEKEMVEEIAKEIQETSKEMVTGPEEFPNDSGMGGPVICPRCNWNTRSPVVPLSDDDKQEFLRTMMGNTQFIKEYTLFNGNLKATFTDLTSVESDNMVATMSAMGEDPLFLPKALKMKLIFALVSLTVGENTTDIKRSNLAEPTDVEKVLKHYDDVLGGISETVCGAVAKLYNEFSETLLALTEAGFDENFWKGAGRD